jgi:hypothetical protein
VTSLCWDSSRKLLPCSKFKTQKAIFRGSAQACLPSKSFWWWLWVLPLLFSQAAMGGPRESHPISRVSEGPAQCSTPHPMSVLFCLEKWLLASLGSSRGPPPPPIMRPQTDTLQPGVKQQPLVGSLRAKPWVSPGKCPGMGGYHGTDTVI